MPATVELLSEPYVEDAVRLFHAYLVYFAPHAAADVEQSHTFLQRRAEARENVFFIAVTDGKPCGFIQLYPLWSSWYCRRIWFLSDLYVDEAARGGGVATRLVERAVAHAAETDSASVMVELPKDEPHLYEFYDKRGFKRDPVFDLARYQLHT